MLENFAGFRSFAVLNIVRFEGLAGFRSYPEIYDYYEVRLKIVTTQRQNAATHYIVIAHSCLP